MRLAGGRLTYADVCLRPADVCWRMPAVRLAGGREEHVGVVFALLVQKYNY